MHLFQHFSKNDNHILDLLSSENNDLFLRYFKTGLVDLIENQFETIEITKTKELPKDFFVNHKASTFVETVRWWIDNKMQETPEQITKYFLILIHSESNTEIN